MEFMISIIFLLFIFMFGLFLFQNRVTLNYDSFDSWQTKLVADRIARNINTAYLLDNNSYIFDDVYYRVENSSVSFENSIIKVSYLKGQYSSAPVLAEVIWENPEFNNSVYFRKENNVVRVTNGS